MITFGDANSKCMDCDVSAAQTIMDSRLTKFILNDCAALRLL